MTANQRLRMYMAEPLVDSLLSRSGPPDLAE